MTKYKVTIDHSIGAENPNDEEWGWKLWSFGRKHTNYKHPDELDVESEDFKQQLAEGRAFLCSYYEHGPCEWSVRREGTLCRFDSVDVAGALVWIGAAEDLPKGENETSTFAARRDSARSFLETYTKFCNGEVYDFSLDRLVPCESCGHEEEECVDSCGGFYDEKDVIEQVRFFLKPGDTVVLAGDAAYMVNVKDFEIKEERSA